ncbi:MAG TPA: class I SAM-dependent methyltransferase [Candidatus Paceibacterota bacterium]
MKQVDRDHYSFSSYAHAGRFASYYYQLREIHDAKPSSVLEVGVGDAVIGNYIRDNTDIKYTSIDVAADVNPDVIGSVLALPFEDKSFDVVCAFEVLEHIPFESFDKAISEMSRVAKGRVLVSVPHFGPPIKFLIKIPFLPELSFAVKIPYHPVHKWNGQHYWELGKKGYSKRAVIEIMSKYGKVISEYVPFENQYHHFFILEK